MPFLRRHFAGAIILGSLAWAIASIPMVALPSHPDRLVLIVTGGNAEAYELAVESLRAVVEREGAETQVLSIADGISALERALEQKPGAIVAVGSAALSAVLRKEYPGPLFATMILASTLRQVDPSRLAGAVVLDLDYSIVVPRLKTHFPDHRRIALIKGPEMSQTRVDAIRVEAARVGFQLEVIACESPKELLDKLDSLWGRFDFIWCFPDRTLYQGKIASTLILETLRKGIPLIGYSEGMVKAGAFVGFFPDYRQIGSQTGGMVSALMRGRQASGVQPPLDASMALNERVMRVLGVPVVSLDPRQLVVFR